MTPPGGLGASTWLVLAAISFATPADATSVGGDSAHVIATAGPQSEYLVIAEHTDHDDCDSLTCTVYALDTRQPGFHRMAVTTVPSTWDEEQRKLCGPAPAAAECVARLRKRMQSLDLEPEAISERLLSRYLQRLPPARRRQLAPLGPPPEPLTGVVISPESSETARALDIALPRGQHVRLELAELWTVPSYRRYIDVGGDVAACEPERDESCRKATRWVSGSPSDHWVCEPPAKEKTSAALDCSARASVVAPVVRLPAGQNVEGRRALVAPGDLDDARQRVPITDLVLPTHVASTTFFPTRRALVVVSELMHNPSGNGTVFPVVVCLPWEGLGGTQPK